MESSARREYILGTSDAELARLAFQHDLWRGVTGAFLDRLSIAEGSFVLDAGSGPGFDALELALRVGPRGRVVALDSSARWERHLMELVKARGRVLRGKPPATRGDRVPEPDRRMVSSRTLTVRSEGSARS